MIVDSYDYQEIMEAWGYVINSMGFTMNCNYLDAKPVKDFGIIDYMIKACDSNGHDKMQSGRLWGKSRSMELMKAEKFDMDNTPQYLLPFNIETALEDSTHIKTTEYYSIWKCDPNTRATIAEHYRQKIYGKKIVSSGLLIKSPLGIESGHVGSPSGDVGKSSGGYNSDIHKRIYEQGLKIEIVDGLKQITLDL
jgi:hypothetical protein